MCAQSLVVPAMSGGEGLPVIFGQYRIIRILGRGGMGTVYEAEHLHLQRRVAIKTVSTRSISDSHTLDRFRREMVALGRLVHPNVVQAYDAGEIEGQRYLAMEYIDGVDVEAIAAGSSLPIADCCEIVRQAALGLHHAHQNGLTHRDVKPRNLLLGRDGIVRVADLGLARIAGDGVPALTQAGNVLGTYDYISPEQVATEASVGPRSDLYSLGCTLYRLVAGAPPFSGREYDTPARKLMAQLHSSPPPVESVRPDTPPQISDLIQRLMAKEPEDRPESAAVVADLLAKHAEGARLPDLLEFALVPSDTRQTRSTVACSALQTAQKSRSPLEVRGGAEWIRAAMAIGIAGLVATIGFIARGNRPTPDRLPPQRDPPREIVKQPVLQPRWRPLLRDEPRRILWNHNAQTFLQHDREKEQLLLRTDGLGILGLGEAPLGQNTLQLDVRQLQWNGGFGVAVESAPAADSEEQFVELAILKNHGPDQGNFPLIAVSKRIALRASSTGIRVLEVIEPGGSRSLPNPGLESQLLEIHWDDTRISRARWAGIELSDLLENLTFRREVTTSTMQRFGIFVERAELSVSAARWLNEPVEN